MQRLQKSLQLSTEQLNFANGIPIYFITIQVGLSKLLDSVQGIGAGILTLRDIISVNKKTDIEEVRSFF